MASKEWKPSDETVTDEQWDLISDLFVDTGDFGSKMGRPRKWAHRQIVEAIFYVLITGCQWRRLPERFPHWNTVHRYHRTWSENGTWEQVADRLGGLERANQGRSLDATGAVIDARTVKASATVTGLVRGYDAAKRTKGRKLFAVVDTIGLLIAVSVVGANVSDNVGGASVLDLAARKARRVSKLWADRGFKTGFVVDARRHGIDVETVEAKNNQTGFKVQPRRWVVERTFSWLSNRRRLQIEYEREPTTTEGFIWAAQTRLLLDRLAPNPNR